MMTSTYDRLHVHVRAPWRAVVRASFSLIAAKHRRNPAMCDMRKMFYRRMLEEHRRSQDLFDTFRH